MADEKVLHPALPQVMTPENLALWIKQNQIESFEHTDETELTEEEISELEHKSSLASRALDKLDDLLESFKTTLNSGTVDPIDFTIPPTKGIKELKANRENADAKIESGVNEVKTWIYGIPYPEEKRVLFFDIEGNRFESRDRDMNEMQLGKYDKPLLRELDSNPNHTETVTMYPNRSQENGDEGQEDVGETPATETIGDQITEKSKTKNSKKASGKKSGGKKGTDKKKETEKKQKSFMSDDNAPSRSEEDDDEIIDAPKQQSFFNDEIGPEQRGDEQEEEECIEPGREIKPGEEVDY